MIDYSQILQVFAQFLAIQRPYVSSLQSFLPANPLHPSSPCPSSQVFTISVLQTSQVLAQFFFIQSPHSSLPQCHFHPRHFSVGYLSTQHVPWQNILLIPVTSDSLKPFLCPSAYRLAPFLGTIVGFFVSIANDHAWYCIMDPISYGRSCKSQSSHILKAYFHFCGMLSHLISTYLSLSARDCSCKQPNNDNEDQLNSEIT